MDIKYIQSEPGSYPADTDWQAMSDAERGIYHSLLVYLGCNNGTLLNDRSILRNLCNTTDEIFENFWKKYSHKFIEKENKITHKQTTQALAKARKCCKQKSLAGKASGLARRTMSERRLNTRSTNDELTKAKIREKNSTKTFSKEFSDKDLALAKQKAGLDFADAVDKICESKLFTPSERTCWHAYRKHLAGLGTDWLEQGTAKLRELTGWRDSKPERNTTDLKKAFGGWMVRAAKYKKKEIR